MSIVYARIHAAGYAPVEVVSGVNISDLQLILDSVMVKAKGKYAAVSNHDAYTYHYIERNDTIFICVTDRFFPMKTGHGFLQCLVNEYVAGSDFEATLQERMAWYTQEKLEILRNMNSMHALEMETSLEPFWDVEGKKEADEHIVSVWRWLALGCVSLFVLFVCCLLVTLIPIIYLS